MISFVSWKLRTAQLRTADECILMCEQHTMQRALLRMPQGLSSSCVLDGMAYIASTNVAASMFLMGN
ncbi:hypothetical protein ASF48_09485 [Rathayibacter sp. Leaf299]|nr:hypothetical protein ASF48_09485 [Rathayibacter sp. Leaf299]